jgi:pilus assembly protein Flp/PilA
VILKIKSFIENESGATAIEYALIAIMISVAVIGGATTAGTTLGNSFQSMSESF